MHDACDLYNLMYVITACDAKPLLSVINCNIFQFSQFAHPSYRQHIILFDIILYKSKSKNVQVSSFILVTSELSDSNTNNCKFLVINTDAGSTFPTFLHITVHMQK